MLVCLHKPGGEQVLVAGFQVLSPFFSLFYSSLTPFKNPSLNPFAWFHLIGSALVPPGLQLWHP